MTELSNIASIWKEHLENAVEQDPDEHCRELALMSLFALQRAVDNK
jgi:hypothetical protein